MASLTRGVSFRRQGSSGLSWADTWSFNEEGALIRTTKEEAAMGGVCGSGSLGRSFGGSSLSRIHDLQDDDAGGSGGAAAEGDGEDGGAKARKCEEVEKGIVSVSDEFALQSTQGSFVRSRSMGNAICITSLHCSHHSKLPPHPRAKGTSRLIKWIKRAFGKSKKPVDFCPQAPLQTQQPTSHLDDQKPPNK